MIEFCEPSFNDLWFREKYMGDEETMSYNHTWGGTIPFPENRWCEWYDYWIVNHENLRFYRYLKESESGEFVGDISYHFDSERDLWISHVVILSEHRRKGYGTKALNMLIDAARENGVKVLCDDIAIDNPGISIFLKAGFTEKYRTDEIIMLKKDLN